MALILAESKFLKILCLISYGSRADTILSVLSVYNFLPSYIFQTLADFSEKISKLLNPINFMQINNVVEEQI